MTEEKKNMQEKDSSQTAVKTEAAPEVKPALKAETTSEAKAAPKAEVTPKPKPKPKKDPRDKLYKPAHPNLVLTSSPHDFNNDSVPKIMWNVIAALLPAAAAGVYYFGMPALILLVTCVVSCLATEFACNSLRGRKTTIKDGSAAITGLLLAMTLPPGFSIYSAILGSIFSIAVGKQIFGGLGYNVFNPALLGRAFLQACFPVPMTTWMNPTTAKYADATSSATPLGNFKFEHVLTDHMDLLTGNIGGCIGETCAVAVILGGLYLLVRKYADWRIPLSFIASVVIFGGLFWMASPDKYPDPLFELLSGGLLLGAFFMATDMVTSPLTPKGSLIFGAGCGLLVVTIRFWGGFPEGVMYSILLMNSITPLINRYTRPKFLGEVKA